MPKSPASPPGQAARALGPAQRARARPARRRGIAGEGDALVEHHGEIDAQRPLVSDDTLRGEAQQGAVEMAAERDAVVVDLAQSGEAEDLEAATVDEQRSPPAGKGVQSAEFDDPANARPQRQMVEVGEGHVGPQLFELPGGDPLDRAEGSDRHEGRGRDLAVPRAQPTTARVAVAGEDLEAHLTRSETGAAASAQGLAVPRSRSSTRTSTSGGRSSRKRASGTTALRRMFSNRYSVRSPSPST